MKKLMKSLMLFAAAAMAFTSCEKEPSIDQAQENNIVTMTFVADAPNSRTSVSIEDDAANYAWSKGDKVGFYYVPTNVGGNKKKNSKEATIADDGTATFISDFEAVDGATTYNLGAFYPGNSWKAHANADFFNNVKVEIPEAQALIEGTFDPKADLMMSKPFMDIKLDANKVKSLQFSRIAAIGRMNLKLTDMVEGEVIKSVVFSFAEGTHFNGPVALDLEKSTYTLAEEGTSHKVSLTGELAANIDGTYIFFTCFPGDYSGAYTIEVETDKASYKKEAELTKPLSFTAGNVRGFNATVGNREEKVVEADEIVDELDRANTGVTNTSYADWTYTSELSSVVYKGNSAGGNSSIQLRSNNNNSGIVTTTSAGKVTKVAVTWNSATASGRTLEIYGKNSAYTAASDLYSSNTYGTKIGTIVYGTSTELEIEGDYEYVGLRSKSGAMYLSEIQITWKGGNSGGGETPEQKQDQTLSFSVNDVTVTAVTATIGEDFTAPTLNGAMTTVAYTSSNESVATVDATTGEVTLLAAGETTITAKAAETDDYNSEEASYTLTVVAAQGGGGDSDEPMTASISFSSYSGKIGNGTVVSLDSNIKATFAKGGGTSDPALNSGYVRLYQKNGGGDGGTMTIACPSGMTISKIELTYGGNNQNFFKVDTGTLSADKKTWEGSASTVKFTVNGTNKNERAYVGSIKVTYK